MGNGNDKMGMDKIKDALAAPENVYGILRGAGTVGIFKMRNGNKGVNIIKNDAGSLCIPAPQKQSSPSPWNTDNRDLTLSPFPPQIIPDSYLIRI